MLNENDLNNEKLIKDTKQFYAQIKCEVEEEKLVLSVMDESDVSEVICNKKDYENIVQIGDIVRIRSFKFDAENR